MKRQEIEHLIRAAGAITESDEIIVIGSQSILGAYPDALLRSREADLIPVQHPERWNLVDGVLGELSPFDETFGYFADGVEEKTAILPSGWKNRLIKIENRNTDNVYGLCLEPHDLMVSKLMAGREKDLEFVSIALDARLVSLYIIIEQVRLLQVSDERVDVVLTWLKNRI